MDLFDDETVRSLAERFLCILDAATAAPNTAVGDLPVLSAQEQQRMVVEPNRTERRIGHHLLLDGFDARVVESPHAVAVIFEGEGLTYAEFDARVDAVAQRLVALGVVPETRVALAMRRSVELVIGMYAVLRAGGAYVPVDPDHPLDRVAYILDAADPLVVLTTHRDDFTATGDRLVLHLDDLDDTDRSGKPFDRPTVHPENSAYVIFTSGSTGKPKA